MKEKIHKGKVYLIDKDTIECSHCGIWGDNHRRDEDDFPICKLCFDLVGR